MGYNLAPPDGQEALLHVHRSLLMRKDLGTHTNHIFPARWGFSFSAAAAFVRMLKVLLTEYESPDSLTKLPRFSRGLSMIPDRAAPRLDHSRSLPRAMTRGM
jgi:hypothetical protein